MVCLRRLGTYTLRRMFGHIGRGKPCLDHPVDRVKEGIMTKTTMRRLRVAVVVSVVGLALAVAGVAAAHVFFQKTGLTADANRPTTKTVAITGKLSASAHIAYCTHGRPIKVTKVKTGKSKTVSTNSSGHYAATFLLAPGTHSAFVASYTGRTGGTHPHRHVCR